MPSSVENPTGDVQAMPERDTSAGSNYMKALELYEKSGTRSSRSFLRSPIGNWATR
ncbi:MAG: hypothetical protein ACLRTQ_06240 [Candidatus Borkfalkia sp.]